MNAKSIYFAVLVTVVVFASRLAWASDPEISIEPTLLTISCDSRLLRLPMALAGHSQRNETAFRASIPSVEKKLRQRQLPTKPLATPFDDRFERHVIAVKFKDGLHIRAKNYSLTDEGTNDLLVGGPALGTLGGARWERMHNLPEDRLEELRQNAQRNLGKTIADLNLYFFLFLPPDVSEGHTIDALNALDIVELAEPVSRPAPAPLPPDFQPNQGYLASAPEGINAAGTWASYQTRGAGVKLADIEYDFNSSHQDLPSITIIGNPPSVPPNLGADQREHGAAVLGQLAALKNGWGTTGIAVDCSYYFSCPWSGTVYDVQVRF